MPAWHSSLLSTEEFQGFWISQDKRAQGTSWTDDDNLLKAAFGRMLEWVHGGNVLFQCQPCAGNRNQTSHNNDTFTRWSIRYQLDELSLGNLCVFMWQIAREREWGKNGLDMINFKITMQIMADMRVSTHSWGRWLQPVTGWDDVMSTWCQRPVSVWCELPVWTVSTLSGGWGEA